MTSHSLQLVADPCRRRIIHYLRHETEGTTTLDDLADQVYRCGLDSETGPRQGREELAIQLHHNHLPKLADHGVVDFDPSSGVVEYRSDEQVETVLDSVPGERPLSNL